MRAPEDRDRARQYQMLGRALRRHRHLRSKLADSAKNIRCLWEGLPPAHRNMAVGRLVAQTLELKSKE